MTTIKLRRDNSGEWTTKNPILHAGEPGIELDTHKFKIGDGVNNWNDLEYFIPTDIIEELITEAIADATFEGVPGPKGDKGDTGDTGPQGATGATGSQGPKGDTGDQGSTGATGSQGVKGDTGNQGSPGATGSQGVKGDTGDQGPPGSTGATGSTGADGLSAYEIAVDNGFVGTESEWLASLIGADGADGVDGVDGEDGAPGATGSQGIQGIQGVQGIQGTTGATGSTGATGATGPAGASGGITPKTAKWSQVPPGPVGSNVTMGLNIEYVIPVPVAADGAITDIQFEVATAAGAGGIVRVGIRNGNDARRPGTASLGVEHGTQVVTTSTGSKSITLASPYTVTAGSVVYISLVAQVSSCIVKAINAADEYLLFSAAPTGNSSSAVMTQSGVSGALPANFTPNGDDWAPRVGIKWQ